MIKDAYVSFEVAKLLKEKGFAEPLVNYYYTTKGKRVGYLMSEEQYLCPTHQMACAWLREVHNLFILVGWNPIHKEYFTRIINMTDGYLTIHAKTTDEVNEEEKGKYVRRERFMGECSRTFYVGEDVKEEEIKASFKNGILNLEVPKVNPDEKKPEKKYIEIED